MRGKDVIETHFSVTLVSDQFTGLSALERHRKVNDALASELDSAAGGTVHALSIKAKTPEQWAKLSANKQ